jgi:hypothetical protein
MISKMQAAQIIDKLTELTQHNQIKWESGHPEPYMNGPDSRVDLVYTTEHIGRQVRIYLNNFKFYLDEDRYAWDSEVNFEFIDNFGNSLGMLPKTPNAFDLLRAVQYQNPQIGQFYNDLFK